MIPSADAVVFAGFVPVEQPQLTILVKIERPRNSLYGAEVAAPVFRTIAEQLLAFYRVPPPQALIESRQ
jgi:cell division protein FtsI/penicillin-binding protein 2